VGAALSYVFCLVSSSRRPAVRGVKTGVPGGAQLRAIDVGERLWAIAEDVPASDYDEAALARGLQDLEWVGSRAVAHQRVIDQFLGAEALLPMQLFTLFTSDDRVVEYVRADRTRIKRILKRVERKVEWGLRLTWDENAVRAKVEARHANPKGSRRLSKSGADLPGPRSGSAYLSRKRDLLDVNRARLTEARAEATRVYKAMSRTAVAAQRRTGMERAAPGSRLLLDAAFLVSRPKTQAFRTAVRKYARELRGSGVSLALTGPWPAYNFIT
jgi:hypothetical protein